MRLAKDRIDVGLFTNQRQAQLDFWQEEIGLTFDHLGKLGGGVHQLRHHVNGSVLKINHVRDPLPEDAPAAGWRELLIARAGQSEPRTLRDPDGNRVTLVPPGFDDVEGIGLRVVAEDLEANVNFYTAAFGAEPLGSDGCRLGDSVLRFQLPGQGDPRPLARPPYQGQGYRYITVQIFDCDAEHARILSLGGTEGRAPRTIGTTTRYSFVLDPGGNWIEVSQRAELAGGLGPGLDRKSP